MLNNPYIIPITKYSLVVCRNHVGKYLCVKQKNGKWWISGGGVQHGQTYEQAAIRQVKQQAGIDVKLKGILAIDQVKFTKNKAFRVIYYAQPVSQLAEPKQFQDKQSKGAKFLSISEILALKSQWRFAQIYNYPRYIEEGGQIFPLQSFVETKQII